MKNSSLDAAKLHELGWKGCFSAKEGFSHTVAILRERIGAKSSYVGGIETTGLRRES